MAGHLKPENMEKPACHFTQTSQSQNTTSVTMKLLKKKCAAFVKLQYVTLRIIAVPVL
jgi:hypothetical protein